MHVSPAQQPSGQDVGLHTHAPPEHIWPVVHAAAPPHVHLPAAEQASPEMPQSMQPAPPAPQDETLSAVVQAEPVQQPDAQFPAPHSPQAPPRQDCGLVQVVQWPPPEPHAPDVSPGWQAPLASQHPVGHEVALHSQ